ncbi:hypothetical protein [Salisediminibacterium halotolerans]|uniref:hypothetical protein n=1 Tax=Salisediminibacterium halotolerans TaxID=517425 RepID=UPI000EACB3D5|nr:hypothetical protein [Salisediminibacterium halotolerans]RLJ69693.1 hypothetical protein BCL39_2557 [Actinophytocola xinjiangensis]RPE89751.1 hypothetical protein EDD67_0528 [Salisediminibacterium halotolerans]TWG32587.1 hypothetical protein BCL52_2552 [Salisediminibacterium halotolerans]GEL08086.1 hypothetical protein SHA02_15020 [Salisediminibacterium halotolerans]
MTMSKRYAIAYASVFSAIWIGYGLYSVITDQPGAMTILLFGIGFAIFVSLLTWFATWIVKHYQKIDVASKEILDRHRAVKAAKRRQQT